MATALDKSHTTSWRNMAVQAQQLQDNNGVAVDMTELTALTGTTATPTNLNQLVSTETAVGGTVATAPTSGTVAVSHVRFGPIVQTTFTLTAARIPHTDAAASGSSGSLKLYTFPQGNIKILGATQKYTAIVINSTCVTTSAVGLIACGTVAADAGDGALSGTEVDEATATSQFTLSSGNFSAAVTKLTDILTALDGTSTAKDVYLNESFTAATSSSNGSLDLTGYIIITWVNLGDV